MTQMPPQLILTSWLDDKDGPARLTERQRELVTAPHEISGANVLPTSHLTVQTTSRLTPTIEKLQNTSISSVCSPQDASNRLNSLSKLLGPEWTPNEFITMFNEEREKIVARGEECKELLAKTDSVLKELTALKDLYLYVSPRTSQLHSECKNIIQERNELKESFDRINLTLNKQEELRSIYKRMPEIKSQIITVLNSVCKSYQTTNKQEKKEPTTPLDEYYGRFFIECRRFKDLTGQLELCLSTSSTDELLLHLEEIYTLYFDIREQLIEPLFSKNLMWQVSKADRNYCDLFRQACTSLIRTLRNEIQLFYQIFPTTSNSSSVSGSSPSSSSEQLSLAAQSSTTPTDHPVKKEALNSFLELICKVFYENLRPVVIHVNHLETLTELYKLLTETMKPEVNEESFQTIINSLAEDVQERMIFRAEVFIQESVLEYKPSQGDLAYPEKLEFVRGGELKDFQSMWYPTVQRTVLALFYLHRVFDALTFRELAQEVVLACFKSLDIAQRLVDQRHNGTKIEATLFLSKHLAIIRDQLQSYGIERISFQAQSKLDPSTSELVVIETNNLESMLRLFQNSDFTSANSNESLWSQLNETILSGTKWTLRATRMQK